LDSRRHTADSSALLGSSLIRNIVNPPCRPLVGTHGFFDPDLRRSSTQCAGHGISVGIGCGDSILLQVRVFSNASRFLCFTFDLNGSLHPNNCYSSYFCFSAPCSYLSLFLSLAREKNCDQRLCYIADSSGQKASSAQLNGHQCGISQGADNTRQQDLSEKLPEVCVALLATK
jgi:hypothetical protein